MTWVLIRKNRGVLISMFRVLTSMFITGCRKKICKDFLPNKSYLYYK